MWSTYILLHKQLPKKNVIENNRAIKITKKVVFGEKFKHLLKDTTEEQFNIIKMSFLGFPGGAVVESLPANAGDTGSSPGLGRSHMLRSD